jgi:hypothetical protein
MVDARGVVIRRLVILYTKEALENLTFEAICPYFLYCIINNFRIWLVVHWMTFSILVDMPAVLVVINLAAYAFWRFLARVLTLTILMSSRRLLTIRLTFEGPVHSVMCFWSVLRGQILLKSCHELEEVSLASNIYYVFKVMVYKSRKLMLYSI